MHIEIWSDIACPWCYIGKRRLEKALADFDHADQVDVVFRSFELDPSAPKQPTETAEEMITRKYGMSAEQAAEMRRHVTSVAEGEGLHWQHERTAHANTRDSHRLLHLAAELGLQAELKEALFHTNFVEARNVADHAVLREVALSVGLPAQRVDAVLASDEFAADVRADVDQARAYGANGVPFFVVDQKYGVSGAQPTEVLAQLLDRAWRESHPLVEMVAGEADGVCGPDGCAL